MEKKKIEIIWTKPAKEDLQKIYNYLSEISILIADRQIDRIIHLIDLLEIGFTKIGKVEPLLENRKYIYRFLVQDNYKIIYHELNTTIVIDMVFDSRQNPKKIEKKII